MHRVDLSDPALGVRAHRGHRVLPFADVSEIEAHANLRGLAPGREVDGQAENLRLFVELQHAVHVLLKSRDLLRDGLDPAHRPLDVLRSVCAC